MNFEKREGLLFLCKLYGGGREQLCVYTVSLPHLWRGRSAVLKQLQAVFSSLLFSSSTACPLTTLFFQPNSVPCHIGTLAAPVSKSSLCCLFFSLSADSFYPSNWIVYSFPKMLCTIWCLCNHFFSKMHLRKKDYEKERELETKLSLPKS